METTYFLEEVTGESTRPILAVNFAAPGASGGNSDSTVRTGGVVANLPFSS